MIKRRVFRAFRLGSVAAFIVCLGGCYLRCGGPKLGAAGGFNPIAATGPEIWKINGISQPIDATYYLALPEGMQFTVEVPVSSAPATQAEAEDLAWPVIQHVYQQKIYERSAIEQVGKGPAGASRIGIALVAHSGSISEGTRVGMSIREIEERLANAPVAPEQQ